jgi:hypothetical protein
MEEVVYDMVMGEKDSRPWLWVSLFGVSCAVQECLGG